MGEETATGAPAGVDGTAAATGLSSGLVGGGGVDSFGGTASNADFENDSAVGNATIASDATADSSAQARAADNVGVAFESGPDASRVSRAQKKRDDLEKGRFLARRGLFAAHELTDETLFNVGKKLPDRVGSKRIHSMDLHSRDYNDFGNMDKHCILRLPEHIANVVRRRMQDNVDIGLHFEPTGRYDYREYKITFKGVDEPLFGILAELPCLVEAHKTLDCDLLIKSADVSQIMLVYTSEQAAHEVAEQLKNQRLWEWPDGLTPPTKNIRRRKFKNFEVYANQDVKEAEREALVLLNGLVRDSYHYEIKSADKVAEVVESYKRGNIKERIIGPDEDVAEYIAALEQQEQELAGDVSEVMFNGDPNMFTRGLRPVPGFL